MPQLLAALFWILIYLFLVAGSLFLMRLGVSTAGRNFWVEFSIALGFIGLAQIILQFPLIARFRRLTAPYGIDAIMYYHRQIGTLAVLAVVLHPVILVVHNPAMLHLANPLGGTAASRYGVWATIALVAIVLLSVFRRQLHLSYEVWRISHRLLALLGVGLAVAHVALAGPYIQAGWKLGFWIMLASAGVAALAYPRLIGPLQQARRPYRIVDIKPEAEKTWSLMIEPMGHDGMSIEPGQFAWLKFGHPFSIDEHPFSFSSSAEGSGSLEFGIKQVGDFTNRLPLIDSDVKVYVDGPHGSFSIDRIPSAGYVFIAGGIGIVPIMSMIRTMADRKDRRPTLLVYAAHRSELLAYHDELDRLSQLTDHFSLQTVYVLEEPPEDWDGEVGFVTMEMLARHWPEERIRRDVLICGPDPMIASVENSLRELGVPQHRIHYERFELV